LGTWLDGAGNDVVIGAGAGVTNVVVHRQGVVEFVRTLAGGGALVTDAIASERRADEDDAEAIKRGLVEGADADATARRALRSLVYEVATSIEFHLNLQDDSEVRQVTLAGGGARLATLRTMLEEQLGVPVVLAEQYHGVRVGKLHLDQNLVDGNGDVFSVALGLALGPGVDLLPKQVRAARTARRQLVGAGVATGLVVAGLAGVTVARVAQARDAEAIADRSEHDVNVLRAEVAAYHDVATLQANVASRTQAVRTALQGDIAWTRVLQDVASAVPANAWLTTFNASHSSVQITAKGYDQTAPAQWLQRAGSTSSLANVWLTTSTAYDSPVRPLVQFSSKATITSTSDRVADYLPGNR
jgi:Tfp pilus assembly protein PilN